GASGSGKSSLLDVIEKSLIHGKPINCEVISKADDFFQVISVSQEMPYTSSLSSIATYSGIFDSIRDEFAKIAKKQAPKISKSYFSYNSKGGRCEPCKGQGFIKTSLDFLPDVYSICPDCDGKRYEEAALKYKIGENSIADVLEMSVNEAFEFFYKHHRIKNVLKVLQDTNLGYLKLGQRLNTLSGGELQRLKLAVEFLKPGAGKRLFLLDEPTTGLHYEDVKHLVLLFEELVQNGNTLIIAEHNPTIIVNADYIIDLGPGGGKHGGNIVAQGNAKAIANENKSITGNYLNDRM
ncbi:MAG: ATP-binding cassette domain-containing protein, partial [Bacteroidales bacterium]|nr:ATP-binding cassette domain-containing protein [Bacteroidales bacterium]